MENKEIKILTNSFIQEIWNEEKMEKIGTYLHCDYVDHSLPASFPRNAEGLLHWIKATSLSFEHNTTVEAQVTEDDQTMLKIKMNLKHMGKWRDIEPTGASVSVVGYRYYRISDEKIIEHWALIDGNAIENQLRDAVKGCKIQE